jgi:radical SAM superfamily enzyme
LPEETIKAAVVDVVGVVCHAVTLTESSTAQKESQELELVQLLNLMVSKAVAQLDSEAEEAVMRGLAFTSQDDQLVEAPWVSQLTKTSALVRELMEWAAMQR